MKVRITRRAYLDIEEIGDWIADQNSDRAASFTKELFDRYQSLGDQPRRFPVAHIVRGRNVHKLTHGDYLIFYFIVENRVDVARVIHGSRDWASIVKGI